MIADLLGKAGHMRTVPIRDWVKAAIEEWQEASGIRQGALLRWINKTGGVWGNGMTAKVLGEIVRDAATYAGIAKLLRTTCAALVPAYATLRAANWIRSNSCSGTSRFRPQNDTWAASRSYSRPSMTGLALGQTRTADRNTGLATSHPPLGN